MANKVLRNRAIVGLDRIFFEQVEFAKATGTAGCSIADDGIRFIYAMIPTSATAASFWRYDTWWGGWQQLASPPTTTITLGKTIYVEGVGKQRDGQTFGSILSFQANGTICYWYRYDISSNSWSALSTTNVPASFGIDAYICFPEQRNNAYDGAYHSGVTKTITTSAIAAVGATTVSVAALPIALIADTVLDFGKAELTLSADAKIGDSTLNITAFPRNIAAGTVFRTKSGFRVIVKTAYTANSLTLSVYPIKKELDSGDTIWRRIKAVLTASAAASATSVTVSALMISLNASDTFYYYDNMYLLGNNGSYIYRYSISGNAWATTSANSGNPAMPAVTGTCGAGCAIKWLPNYYPDRLYILRGGSTASMHYYDLVANTMNAVAYKPDTETFTTGTGVASRSIGDRNSSLLIYQNNLNKWFEFNPVTLEVVPYAESWQYPDGTALVGDRVCCMTTPDLVETIFFLQHSTTSFLKGVCLDA